MNPTIPLATLKLNDRNPRTITHERFAALVKSIQDFPAMMELRPIIVDSEGVVLGGNMRYRACEALGMKDIPESWVKRSDRLTAEERRRFILMDNEGFGAWDFDLLASDYALPEMKDWGMDLERLEAGLGMEGESGNDAEPQIERAEELQKEWKTEIGQLWQLGDHRLLCGNSTKSDDVARVMGCDKATLVFTDPPYGVAIGAKNRLLSVFKNTREICADDCSVFVCSPQGGELGMMMMMQEAGLTVRHVLNWVKNAPTFSMGRLDYDYQHEPILFTWMKTHKRKRQGCFQTSIWPVDKPRASKDHPTMKPVELPVNAILNHTDAGDLCFDPFVGSGTVIMACEQTGRRCRAIEISPGYVAVALQRWASATGKMPTRIETNKVQQ